MPKKKESKRKDGLAEVKYTVGKKLDGKPIRKSFYGTSKLDCEQKYIEWLKTSQFEEIDETITLSDWADKWLKVYKSDVRDITYDGTYRYAIEAHIKPHFKDARLAAIRQIDIKDFLNSKKNLSQSALDKIRITLKALFAAAIENDLLLKNPVANVKAESNKKPEEKRAYTKEEVADIIKFAKTHIFGAGIIIMLKTGLRRSELMGLKWNDIDYKRMIITVKNSISTPGGSIDKNDAKTEASMAEIPFDDELRLTLQGIPLFKKMNKGKGKNRKEIIIKNEYVFSNKYGQATSPNNYERRDYKKFMDDYKKHYAKEHEGNEPRILTPHELRHTFGSLIYEATRDIYITSKLMRHANIDITVKTYVHEQVDTKREAINKVLNFTK